MTPPAGPPHPLGVVHLIRRENGPAVAERFFRSYDDHPGGVDHGLILVFKGFGRAVDPAYEPVLRGRRYLPLFLPDDGFDLVPYRRAAEAFACEHFCFLNSFSRLLDREWLAKLYAAVRAPSVGAASATGSWGTFYSHRKNERGAAWAAIRRRHGRRWFAAAAEIGRWAARDVKYWLLFGDGPSPHLRTNALVMSRETMLRTWTGLDASTKMSAWRFEHGRGSMTRRVRRLGLEAVVVGRDGRSYRPDEWDRSDTFWQGEQGNLLVADNQSDRYATGPPELRAELTADAWGRRPARRRRPDATGSPGRPVTESQ